MVCIRIETITGKSILIDAENANEIREKIENEMGIPQNEQILLLNGKKLTDEIIENNCLINLIISLEGGAKGKKKKKEVKKTKKKHQHKKVKLAILKYYKVDGEKVIRLKQMCKVCPPGTFLAEHSDRLYCGRCRTAYAKVVDNKAKGKGEKGGKKEKGKKK